MGLANLVPGISGGTMLLAAGVYTRFIRAVADVTTLRFRPSALVVLACVGGAAVLSILFNADLVKDLVIERRWIMYSLFIGLTLGGVPLLLRMLRPIRAAAWFGSAAGFAVMVVLFLVPPGGAGDGEGGHAYGLLFLSGLAGAAAMVLPGISGGYLLILLGQYVTILGAVGMLEAWVAGAGPEGRSLDALAGIMHVVVPVGLGVVAGVVGVSNLVRVLLGRFEQATLGVLLGLVLGSVLGLWPFQQGVPPVPGEVVKGVVVTEEAIEEIDPEDWRTERFTPTTGQIAGSLALAAAGFAFTQTVGLLGRERRRPGEAEPPSRPSPESDG